MRECRCCGAGYKKGESLIQGDEVWYETSSGLEKIGFCAFCDKNNKYWYTPELKCHNG